MVAQVIELIDVQQFRGQQILNRFHYVDTTGVADPAVLVSDYINDVLPKVTVIQTTEITHVAVRRRKVYPTADLAVETSLGTPVAGGLALGVGMPSYAAMSFKWAIGATVILQGGGAGHIKRGGARLAGLRDGDWSGDTLSNPGLLAPAASWAAELRDPGTDAFLQVVATYLTPLHTRQHTVQAYALVIGASAPALSTQNTRKVLRGRTF